MTLFRMGIEGIDQTAEVEKRLISLSLTDKNGTEADELSLTLSDHDAALPLPIKGNRILLWLAMPDTGDMLKVNGSRIATPFAPPKPGSTPIRTPRKMPTNM